MRVADVPPRHGWAWLRPDWRDLLLAPITPDVQQAIDAWRGAGRPFIVAGSTCTVSGRGLRLGLGTIDKRRMGFQLDCAACLQTAPPPVLSEAATAAPFSWRLRLEHIDSLARSFGFEVGVYGSLAWTFRTGVKFLRKNSDLDLLLTPATTTLEQTYALLDVLQSEPLHPVLDGELLLKGAAVAWREFARRPPQLLVKHSSGVSLRPRAQVEVESFGTHTCS